MRQTGFEIERGRKDQAPRRVSASKPLQNDVEAPARLRGNRSVWMPQIRKCVSPKGLQATSQGESWEEAVSSIEIELSLAWIVYTRASRHAIFELALWKAIERNNVGNA
jgi:hypothetical protein